MNILLLEKSNSLKTIVGKIAAQRGHCVFSPPDPSDPSDSESVWKILDDKKIDIILSGYEINNPGSADFLKKLSASSHSGIPVLALVDEINGNTRETLYKQGITDYISRTQVSEGGLSSFLDIFLRDDRMIEALRRLDLVLLDEGGEIAERLKKIFTLKKIGNIDYIDDAINLLESEKQYAVYILNFDKSMFSIEKIAAAIREKNSRCIIMAITGIDREWQIDSIIYAGADDVIFSPFKTGVLLSKLKANARIYNKYQEVLFEFKKNQPEQHCLEDL